jgi:hypothetical protein
VKLKLKIRNEINEIKESKEYMNYVTKLKWFGYINRKRHEDNILNELEQIYGSDMIFVIGDWSGNGIMKYISTSNKQMVKLLSKKFKVFLIDEYRTSKLYHKNDSEGTNLIVQTKKGEKKLHSVLTFKMGNNNECINRDYNSVLNMEKIVKSLIETIKRPIKYSRQKINHIITVKSEEIYGSVANVHIGESKTNLKSKPKKEKIIVIKSKIKSKIKKRFKNENEQELLN